MRGITQRDAEILLVEDLESDAELIQRALSGGGVLNPIRVIRDGEEARRFLVGCRSGWDRPSRPCPGLILLDLKLPRVSGFELLGDVKSHPITRRIPVIVLTSSAQPSDIDRAYDLGANSFLVKPVTISDFRDMAATIRAYWILLNMPASTIG